MNDIEDNMDKIRNADKLVIDSEHDLKSAIEEIYRLEGSLQFRLNERTMIDTAMSLLKDGGIKTKIIKQYVPIINKLVNKYLDRMGFFVNFNIDENFNEVIKSSHRDEFSYANFSEGEKMRIDLSILFTWRQIAKTLLRNDYWCRNLGFQITKSSAYEKYLALMKKKRDENPIFEL
jgi:hypothetical protein